MVCRIMVQILSSSIRSPSLHEDPQRNRYRLLESVIISTKIACDELCRLCRTHIDKMDFGFTLTLISSIDTRVYLIRHSKRKYEMENF